MIHLKTTADIDGLRECAALVSRTLATLGPYVKAGITTAELDAMAEAFIRDSGATPAFKGYHGYPATLNVSVNDVVVHGIPGAQVLQDGDIVAVDCGVIIDGLYGDSAYTFSVGAISPDKTRLCRVTHEALQAGIQNAVAGNRIGDIASAIQEHCESNGYGVVRDLVGHGIGRHLHEEPQVPNYGRRGSGKKLKEGMVLCIEPMINQGTYQIDFDADGWTVRAADGLPSAHYEKMVVVRRGQPEVLTRFDLIEQVIEAPYNETVQHG